MLLLPNLPIDTRTRDMTHPHAGGRFLNVARATVRDATQTPAVLKWLREDHRCHRDHMELAEREARLCADVVTAFQNASDTHGWKVRVLVPLQLTRETGAAFDALAERFLPGFCNFYRSADDLRHLYGSKAHEVLKALLHFSIEESNGRSMITNLQGCIDERSSTIFLSGPVIRKRGDLSSHYKQADVSAFLERHRCSDICRPMHSMPSPSYSSSRSSFSVQHCPPKCRYHK